MYNNKYVVAFFRDMHLTNQLVTKIFHIFKLTVSLDGSLSLRTINCDVYSITFCNMSLVLLSIYHT